MQLNKTETYSHVTGPWGAKLKSFIAVIPFALVLALSTRAPAQTTETWPMWRGPSLQGMAKGNPPITFGEKKNLKWKIRTPGHGESSPVIWGDRLFLLTAVKTDKILPPSKGTREIEAGLSEESRELLEKGAQRFGIEAPGNMFDFNVLCLSRRDGRQLWETTVRTETPHEGHHNDHGYASASPVTDGKHVWCFFGSRGMHCLDMDGKLKWSRDLGKMVTRARFGEASSPALTSKAVITLMDQEGPSKILALDRLTGKTLWERERDEGTSWTTPRVTMHDGRELVIVNGTTRTRCYDAEGGEVLWECGGQTVNVIPSPLVGFDMVYCASGFRGNALQAIKLGHSGDLTGTDAVAWEVDRYTPYVPSPLLHGENLYMLWGFRGKISCLNAKTGASYYDKEEIEGIKNVYASPVGVRGRIYIVSRDGKVAVLAAGTELKVLAVNELDDDIDASPAIIGDEMYLRGKSHLYCIAKD